MNFKTADVADGAVLRARAPRPSHVARRALSGRRDHQPDIAQIERDGLRLGIACLSEVV